MGFQGQHIIILQITLECIRTAETLQLPTNDQSIIPGIGCLYKVWNESLEKRNFYDGTIILYDFY